MVNNVFVLGGSRNIGYYTSIRLLDAGATVTFLLRNPSVFDEDATIQKYVSTNNARLVKGDALIKSDVQQAWKVATADAPVDVLLFTLGFSSTPSFHILKGFQISPPNLVTASLLNVLSTLPSHTPTTPTPKVIVVTSTGLDPKSRASAPALLYPVYAYLIQSPLQDKLGAERVLHHLAGWDWDPEIEEPGEEVLNAGWKDTEGLPGIGSLNNVVIVRPAMLTNGECLADKAKEGDKLPYRVGEGEVRGYTVSRQDTAHLVAGMITNPNKWEEYKNKQISIAY